MSSTLFAGGCQAKIATIRKYIELLFCFFQMVAEKYRMYTR